MPLYALIPSPCGQLDASVCADTTQAIHLVVEKRRGSVPAESIGHEVDRPERDKSCATLCTRYEAPAACKGIEPEPRVHPWGEEGNHRIECKRQRRPQRDAHDSLVLE